MILQCPTDTAMHELQETLPCAALLCTSADKHDGLYSSHNLEKQNVITSATE